jgi:hypothetical protein
MFGGEPPFMMVRCSLACHQANGPASKQWGEFLRKPAEAGFLFDDIEKPPFILICDRVSFDIHVRQRCLAGNSAKKTRRPEIDFSD